MKKPGKAQNRRISYHGILRSSVRYADLIESYRTQVLSQRTRTIRLLGRKSSAKIIHTLLGFEVQASYKRIQCPDLVTARYLKLFSEIGCHTIKLPYDPTVTERIIPKFEAAIEGIGDHIRELFPRDIPRQRHVTRQVYGIIRKQLG